jgi:hypothetical protein
MFNIVISNKNLYPCPANYIYQSDILEPISISFNLDSINNLIEVVDIQFLSPAFIWNNISDQLVHEWKGMCVSQFQFPTYNRETFIFELTDADKIRYRCIDAACYIAREYGRRSLNSQRIIYYFVNQREDTINACIEFSQMEDNLIDELHRKEKYVSIGELKVCETNDELRWLDYLDIDYDYQNEVSKQTMLRLAVDHLNLNAIPCVENSDAYRFYLTKEEEQLIAECLLKDIINCEMCYFD